MTLSRTAILDQPLACLFEDPDLPAYRVPQTLTELYGGSIGFPELCLYANFVASIDGIVALERRERSGTVISGGSPADRFVMGLLRACAEAVVVAGGTFRATPNHRWTADHIFPALADAFGLLRHDLKRAAHPTLVVVSARGDIDTRHPALEGPSIVSVIDAVRAEGFRTVLTEGGPSFLGQLVAEQLLDELFLTVAPRLVGPALEGSRKSLVEAADVLGRAGAEARLLSLRRHRSYLFLRYRFGEVNDNE